MKIERFKLLKEKGMTHDIMFDIVKYRVIPELNISFDEFILYHAIKFIHENKLWNYPRWEVHLNILMRDYRFLRETIENVVNRAVDAHIEECEKNVEKIWQEFQNK